MICWAAWTLPLKKLSNNLLWDWLFASYVISDTLYNKKEEKQTCVWVNIGTDIFVVFGWTGLWILHSIHEIGGLRDSIHLTFKHKLKQNEICKFYDISKYKNHTGRNGVLFVLVT